MLRLLRWLVIVPLLVGLMLIGLFFSVTDRRPSVERSEAISPRSIAEARRLFSENDPRYQRRGELRRVAIPATLLDEGTNYLAWRYAHGRGRFTVADGHGIASISIPVFGERFLNARFNIAFARPTLLLSNGRVGWLPIPDALLDYGRQQMLSAFHLTENWQTAMRTLGDVGFDAPGSRVWVTYRWHPELLDRARAVALSREDITHIQHAYGELNALFAHRAPGSIIPLSEVVAVMPPPDAQQAVQRARTTLLVLASYLAEKDLAALIPMAKRWPRLPQLQIVLAGRHDLAQHYIVSAALAAWSGEPVADAIGLYKELDDAQRGSGFSFIDLTADRSGTRFGEKLIASPAELLSKLKLVTKDTDLIPYFSDFPESLFQDEFQRRFENEDSPKFKALKSEIERRIAQLALYQ